MATLRLLGRAIVLGSPACARISTALRRALSSTTSSSVDVTRRLLTVQWSGSGQRSKAVLPLAWLRDNCQCSACFHPTTLSRLQLMENFDPRVGVASAQLDDEGKTCSLTWTDGHVSSYNYDWLKRRSFDAESQRQRSQWYSGKHELWGSEYVIRRHKFDEILQSDSSLLKFLNDMEAFGLTVVEGAPISGPVGLRAVVDLCNRVAFPMETNYGKTFTVKSKLNPSNLAYTPARLGLHVDLPFYKDPPGIQLLHCLAQSDNISGGENFFSDGFHAANLLKAADPDGFRALTTQLVDFYDYGTDYLEDFHMLCRQRVISLTNDGDYEMICYNNQVRDTYLNLPAEEVQAFYDALKKFDTLLHGKQCAVFTKLKEGDIVTFDNRRVLHGRNAYTVRGTAERHLEGAYLRWDEVYSRIRRLEESVRLRQP